MTLPAAVPSVLPSNMFQVVTRCFQILQSRSEKSWRTDADLEIAPDVRGVEWNAFGCGSRLIEAGEAAARTSLGRIAELIDRVAMRGSKRVLAIAAGHLREVKLSATVQSGKLEEFVAFDQDEASLAVVTRDYGRLGIRAMYGSVRQILSGEVSLPQYDFVYAAGLFDYLNRPVAAALTRRMFDMTLPGGLMLIPNFLTGLADASYMEAFMDWHLIYRNETDMHALAAELPRNQVANYWVFKDTHDAITYLLVNKAK